jgi:hypothetical protein
MWEVGRVGLRHPSHGGRLLRRYRWDVTTVQGTVFIPIDEGDHIAVSNSVPVFVSDSATRL